MKSLTLFPLLAISFAPMIVSLSYERGPSSTTTMAQLRTKQDDIRDHDDKVITGEQKPDRRELYEMETIDMGQEPCDDDYVDVDVAYSTLSPTDFPTAPPTPKPTADPTPQPTADPTPRPTADPTKRPTVDPTKQPTTPLTTQPPTLSPTYEDDYHDWNNDGYDRVESIVSTSTTHSSTSKSSKSSKSGKSSKSSKGSKSSSGSSRSRQGSREGGNNQEEGASSGNLNKVSGLIQYSETNMNHAYLAGSSTSLVLNCMMSGIALAAAMIAF